MSVAEPSSPRLPVRAQQPNAALAVVKLEFDQVPKLRPVMEGVKTALAALIEKASEKKKESGEWRIADLKPDMPREGVVQDCEFGLILLLGLDALRRWKLPWDGL